MNRVEVAGQPAVVHERLDVVTNPFQKGGYARFQSDRKQAEPDEWPFIGVAIIKCGQSTLRVAFILSDTKGTKKHHNIFRTVGFDWINRFESTTPYLPEVFALASLLGCPYS